MFLLFDCNNFFASCEQVFRPDWKDRPLVVLSNNDGCVISRSPEAKALGIAMGEPYFKCRDRLEEARAVVCSANFDLYGDLSDRIMGILEETLPEVHQYSIDEAFAHVSTGDWESTCRQLRKRIQRWTGVTVSVGVAPTRTLCKLANETAKHAPEYRGVLSLLSPVDWEPLLKVTSVAEVWGVGRRLAPKLRGLGIHTAWDLAHASLSFLRMSLGVQGERLALELRGISCLGDDERSIRTQVMVSRSLKEGVRDLSTLHDVLCRFCEKAGRILRSQGLVASQLHIILRTSRYETGNRLYASEQGVSLPQPCDDTRVFIKYAIQLLNHIYRSGFDYKKIGVMLTGLESVENIQPTFDSPQVTSNRLMSVLDTLQRGGYDVHFARQHSELPWRNEFRSQRYTTCWDEIPEVH